MHITWTTRQMIKAILNGKPKVVVTMEHHGCRYQSRRPAEYRKRIWASEVTRIICITYLSCGSARCRISFCKGAGGSAIIAVSKTMKWGRCWLPAWTLRVHKGTAHWYEYSARTSWRADHQLPIKNNKLQCEKTITRVKRYDSKFEARNSPLTKCKKDGRRH